MSAAPPEDAAKTIVIHIGYHKTASTYLQDNFFPQVPGDKALIIEDRRRVLAHLLAPGFNAEEFRNWFGKRMIAGKYGRHNQPLTILSNEWLSGHPHGYSSIDPCAVADSFKQSYPNAKIIIVVRNQFEYILSIYGFRVAIRGEEYRSLEKFLKEEGPLGLFEKLEYDKLVSHYISLFGKEGVLVLPMELLRKNMEQFHSLITDFIGIPAFKYEPPRMVNTSTKIIPVLQFWRAINYLLDRTTALFRFLHIPKEPKRRPGHLQKNKEPKEHPHLAFYALKKKGTRMLNAIFAHSPKLRVNGCSDYDNLVRRYAQSNARLRELVDWDPAEYGYPSAAKTVTVSNHLQGHSE